MNKPSEPSNLETAGNILEWLFGKFLPSALVSSLYPQHSFISFILAYIFFTRFQDACDRQKKVENELKEIKAKLEITVK